jgi:hypothetical protein
MDDYGFYHPCRAPKQAPVIDGENRQLRAVEKAVRESSFDILFLIVPSL